MIYTRSLLLFKRKIITFIIGLAFGFWITTVIASRTIHHLSAQDINQQVFTVEELATYDGTDKTHPIYLAYDGNVYDVSAGYKYYALGGMYHFLAGRDATSDLNIAGGSIVKRKYPVVGTMTK